MVLLDLRGVTRNKFLRVAMVLEGWCQMSNFQKNFSTNLQKLQKIRLSHQEYLKVVRL